MDDKKYYWKSENKDLIDKQLASLPPDQYIFEVQSVPLTWFRALAMPPLKRSRTLSETSIYGITFRFIEGKWQPHIGTRMIEINIRE